MKFPPEDPADLLPIILLALFALCFLAGLGVGLLF